jgi:shikimate kinase
VLSANAEKAALEQPACAAVPLMEPSALTSNKATTAALSCKSSCLAAAPASPSFQGMHPPWHRGAVILVGFMGAGKTSAGRDLAQRLGWRFVDLDEQIERRATRKIADIFRESGESVFRSLETDALRELLGEVATAPGMVVALGGGAFTQMENTSLLQQARYPIVFLDAPVAELRRRCAVEGSPRPLFQDENQFRQLYEQRRDAYMKADFRVDTVGKTVAEVAAEVGALLGNR